MNDVDADKYIRFERVNDIVWWRSLSGTAKTKTPTSLLVVVAVFGDPSILHGGFSYHQWISCSPFVGCLVVVFVILILLFDSDVYVLRCSAVLLSWCPYTRARIFFLPPPCSALVVLAATHFYFSHSGDLIRG